MALRHSTGEGDGNFMAQLRRIFGTNSQLHLLVLLVVILVALFQVTAGGKMLTPSNAQNMLIYNAYVLILALGMVMVVVIGQIDLSVGSVAAFVSMSVALVMQSSGIPWWVGFLLGLVLGAAIGAWQGMWLAVVGIPGVIVTLAGMMIFRGAVLWESRALSVPVPDQFRALGAGYLPEWGPEWTQVNNSTLLLGILLVAWVAAAEMRRYQRRKRLGRVEQELWIPLVRIALVVLFVGFLVWLFGRGRPTTSFPIIGVIVVVLVVFYHVLTQRTAFGRHVYAVGGNPVAASLSGVDLRKVQFLVMVNMGVLAALAGMLFAGRSTAAGPQDGTSWELDAIAAVFIGGAAVGGGMGTIGSAVMGGVVMAVLNNGLLLMGLGSDKTQVIKGLVLLVAVSFDLYSRKRGRFSVIGAIGSGFSPGQNSLAKQF